MARVTVQWLPEDLTGKPLRFLDLHVHVKLTKSEPFNLKRLFRLIKRGRQIGLGGLAVTEHFHARDFWTIYEALRRIFPAEDGVFQAGEGFFIIPGGEVSLREGNHLVVLAPVDELSLLDKSFHQPLSAGYHPPFAELLEAVQGREVLLIAAHIFRRQMFLNQASVSFLRQLHALEANGRDFSRTSYLLAQASALGLPVVGGSDAHHVWQLGVRATALPAGPASFAAVAASLRRKESGIAGLAGASWRVGLATYYKRIVKAQRRLFWFKKADNLPAGLDLAEEKAPAP